MKRLILILVGALLITGCIVNKKSYVSITNKEFQKQYSENSKVIEECYDSDGYFGGEDRYIIAFKLESQGIYSYLKYIVNTKKFFDATEGFIEGKNITLDEYFDSEYASIAHVGYDKTEGYWHGYYGNAYIGILVDYNTYTKEDIELIQDKIKNDLEKKYGSVTVRIYSTSNFDLSKLEQYKLFLLSNISGCECLLDLNNDSTDNYYFY